MVIRRAYPGQIGLILANWAENVVNGPHARHLARRCHQHVTCGRSRRHGSVILVLLHER